MTRGVESLATKAFVITFASLMTVIGWLAKAEITNMATTLKDIRKDVYTLNSKTMMQEQKYEYKFQLVEKDILALKIRLLALENVK